MQSQQKRKHELERERHVNKHARKLVNNESKKQQNVYPKDPFRLSAQWCSSSARGCSTSAGVLSRYKVEKYWLHFQTILNKRANIRNFDDNPNTNVNAREKVN